MPLLPPPVVSPRRKSRKIKVGAVEVGGDAPISVQSMCTTPTTDVNATLQQIAELTAQVARLRGRPNPGYVDVAKALPVAYAVSIALIGMSVLLIYADLVNPIKIGG